MERDHVDHLTGQWAHERPDLDTRVLGFAARMLRLQRFLDWRTTEVLQRFDLRIGESHVLAALRRAGPPYELTPTDLYRSLLLSSAAMTNRLDRLEARGLIQRIPDEDDQRKTRVSLTTRGRDVIDAAMDAQAEYLADTLADLDDDEQDQLALLLRRLLVRFEREAGRTPPSEPSHAGSASGDGPGHSPDG